MKRIQPATNADLIALMSAEEDNQAREYKTGEWIGMEEEFCDDFALEEF